MTDDLAGAFTALDAADTALDKLDRLCCEPGRSPRMRQLADTLAAARSHVETFDGGEALFEALEDAGAQVGRLQVGCCAPKRLPLYADILESLTTVQLTANAALGRAH